MQASSSDDTLSSISLWSLQIDSVSPLDEGWYDCQVNTEPKVSHKSYLHIKKSPAISELRDEPQSPQVIPEIHNYLKNMQSRAKLLIRSSRNLEQLKEGDPLVLECQIQAVSNTADLYWMRSEEEEALSTDPTLSRLWQIPQQGKATLSISSLIPNDEGSYTCLSHSQKVTPVTIQIKLSGKFSTASCCGFWDNLDPITFRSNREGTFSPCADRGERY